MRHHLLIRALHWLIAGLIIAALLMSTLVMPLIAVDSPEMITSLRRHMMTGITVFVLTLSRFVLHRYVKMLPTPSSGMAWADWLANAVRHLFNVLILTMVASGVGMAVFGRLFPVVFGGQGELPANLATLPLHTIHRYTAITLFAILSLHIGGAFFHQFIRRDGLLSRMGFGCPWKRRTQASEAVK